MIADTFIIYVNSFRWLVSKGRTEEAVKVLKRFERINKSKIPEEVLEEFIVSWTKMSST